MTKNVTFNGRQILKNGIVVGQFEGTRSEVWVILGGKAVARFKYKSPMAGAKHFLRWALGRYSAAEVIEKCAAEAPLLWAGREGYESYNLLKAKEYEAQVLRDRATFRSFEVLVLNG